MLMPESSNEITSSGVTPTFRHEGKFRPTTSTLGEVNIRRLICDSQGLTLYAVAVGWGQYCQVDPWVGTNKRRKLVLTPVYDN